MPVETTERKFRQALDALVDQLRKDRSVLAAILCGSLSHDAVWEKSDIDLVLVTIDDRKLDREAISVYADGVNVHAFLIQRAAFRKLVEGSLHSSFGHSFLAKGELLYTHDESITPLFERLRDRGARDVKLQLLRAATSAVAPLYKAHKFLITRGDLDYTALWILHAASSLAAIEVLEAGQLVDREVVQQALKINPTFFGQVYTDLLNQKKTKENVTAALDAADAYLGRRAATLFSPVLDYLKAAREARSCTEIDAWFKRNLGIDCLSAACEYLADLGLIGKASVSTQLTKRSNVDVQELAFFHLGGPEDDE